jgi:hypothetical protein
VALDATKLKALLSDIDANLTSPGTICVIGSAATILLGQSERQTDGIDVWADASQIAFDALQAASEAAGVTYDPKGEFPRVPYIQIVYPGQVQVPGFNPDSRTWLGEAERTVWSGRKLTVTVPPARSIIASKLLRASRRDIEDCIWLMASHAVAVADIKRAIAALPNTVRRNEAKKNFVLLTVM